MPSSYNSIMSSLGFPVSGPSVPQNDLTQLKGPSFEGFVQMLGLNPGNLDEEMRSRLMQMYVEYAAAEAEKFWNKRGSNTPHPNVGARARG